MSYSPFGTYGGPTRQFYITAFIKQPHWNSDLPITLRIKFWCQRVNIKPLWYSHLHMNHKGLKSFIKMNLFKKNHKRKSCI